MDRYSLVFLILSLLVCGAGRAEDAPDTEPRSSVCADADGVEAYEFGLKIQDAVRSRDLAAFFSLVDGELDRGPRRGYAEGRAFDEIFSASWRDEVLQTAPDCRPVGWRGFMLGNGQLWYRPGSIFAVGGWVPEAFPPVPAGWTFGGGLLSPMCFVYQSLSGDIFEDFARRFSIADDRDTPEFADFADNTGRYFGDPIRPFGREAPSLWRYVSDCAGAPGQFGIEGPVVTHEEGERYAVLAEISLDRCRDLAPGLPGTCLASRLVHRSSFTGGSMGYDGSYGIYGLFQMENGARIVFPLKYFGSENLARNYLEGSTR